jgi:hypothetical protein
MDIRVCKECNKEFTPSSGHLKCPPCRYIAKKKLCHCGNEKAHTSLSCNSCRLLRDVKPDDWRGSPIKHKKGYTMRRVPNHPSGTGYVFEHRLVMEDILGRTLLRNESVHHKNGIKDDNHPDNLELWATAQPSGQRVEDLLAYAREIISIYG